MTDYAAAATTSEPSWTWWMTTAAAAAVRMRNLRDHHRGGVGGGDGFNEHPDDEYAGPNRKRQRIDSDGVRDEFWNTCGVYEQDDGGSRQAYDTVAAGPLDLSVKATLTASAHIVDERREVGDGRSEKDVDEYRATTPVKRPADNAGISNSKSSKKTTGGKAAASGKATTSSTPSAAVKAVTRKLLPQLLMDQRVDRSSPVSGTIIVPATLEDPTTPPPQSYDSGDAGDRDDDYDGGDIDPEFNVVVVTEEARRRLESIPNALGPYKCKLCSVRYSDAFALARHRCRCIVHVRYRCPECDKVFQCPANLASHRRWHGGSAGTTPKTSGGNVRTKNTCNGGLDKQEAVAAVTVVANNVAVKQEEATTTTTTTNNNNNKNKNNNNIDDDDDITDGVTVCGRGKTAGGAVAAIPTAAAGFKKNILHRAVQAAAAAANNDDVGAL